MSSIPAPPKIAHSALELHRFMFEAGASLLLKSAIHQLPRGDGHSVMTLPGFLGADGSTAVIRRFVNKLGYNGIPWGQGRNLPDNVTDVDQAIEFRAALEQTLAEKLFAEVQKTGQRVSLIGWSLGGLYATSLAHDYPDLVRQVITLGTPFGDPRATSIFPVLQQTTDSQITHEQVERWVNYTFDGELEVPVTALYSESDGIVGAGIAKLPEHPKMQNIAVMSSHIGFPFNPLVKFLMADRLSQCEHNWTPYKRITLKPFVHLD